MPGCRRRRLAGEGEAGAQGTAPGDLYVHVAIRPHPIFERDGAEFDVPVGDGPERVAWEAQAAQLPVQFTGQRDDVHHLLRNIIDMAILPSDSVAFSMVLLEAAAAGAIAALARHPALAWRYAEAARARLRIEFSVAGFLGKFAAVYDGMTTSALPSGWAPVWIGMRSSWFQITWRATMDGAPDKWCVLVDWQRQQ